MMLDSKLLHRTVRILAWTPLAPRLSVFLVKASRCLLDPGPRRG
jgi:hypothetical protein